MIESIINDNNLENQFKFFNEIVSNSNYNLTEKYYAKLYLIISNCNKLKKENIFNSVNMELYE